MECLNQLINEDGFLGCSWFASFHIYVKETTALLKVLNHLGRNTEYLDSVVPCIAVAF